MDRALKPDPNSTELKALQRLQSFFNSDELSDLTIRFNGRELKAHKVILCIHSRWFANAFRGSFMEASRPILELHDDDSQAIEGMLRHFYDLDPMSPCETGTLSTDTQTESFVKLRYLVHLYAASDTYDVPILRKKVLCSLTALASQSWPILLYSGELPHIIEAIYASTVQKDCLRAAASELSLEYIHDFRERDIDAFEDLIETVPDFGADIIMQGPLPSPVNIPSHLSETLVGVFIGNSEPLALHMAAKLGDLAQCKLLIRTGTYVNARDINDSTPLHFAAFYSRLPTVKFLVGNARADVNACCDNPAFSTPLAWAQYAGHRDIVDYLTDAGGLET